MESRDVAWNNELLRDPHAVADKRLRVRKMFAAIAPAYDINNRLHSLWIDQYWRRKAVKLAELKPLDTVIDVACGTGDLSIKFHAALQELLALQMPREDFDPHVVGLDFTYEMLPIASAKSGSLDVGTVDERPKIHFINGDAMALPMPDASADVVSIAFGIRNVADPRAAIREFRRVLRPGGRLIILEFSLPENRVLRGMYNFYFRRLVPITATLISGDRTGAYKYLPESVNTFIGREQMMGMMREAGFADVRQFPMTFGVCVCYRGIVS